MVVTTLQPTSIRLSEEDQTLIDQLKKRYGLRSTTSVMAVALRAATGENVDVDTQTETNAVASEQVRSTIDLCQKALAFWEPQTFDTVRAKAAAEDALLLAKREMGLI